MPAVDLVELSWTQTARLGKDAIGLIPIGALEQHGPHLPLGTDMLIADRLARRVAARMTRPVVLTPVPLAGLSDHHTAFAGTVTLASSTLRAILDALVDGLHRAGISRIAVFSAHGGNFDFLADYSRSRPVQAFADLHRWLGTCAAAAHANGLTVLPTDQHAGLLETSQALDLFSPLVRDFSNVQGFTNPYDGWEQTMWTEGVSALSQAGVLGDPHLATAQLGAAINDALTEMLTTWLEDHFAAADANEAKHS